jgi:hypothetical protein
MIKKLPGLLFLDGKVPFILYLVNNTIRKARADIYELTTKYSSTLCPAATTATNDQHKSK